MVTDTQILRQRSLRQRSLGRSLGLMSKYWIAGEVKTRLARDLGFAAAASVHQQFTLHLAEQLIAVADDRHVFTTPDTACQAMQKAVGEPWSVQAQGPGDLGRRMLCAFEFLMMPRGPRSGSHAILIGGDLPTLTPCDIDAAFDELNQADIVLGPASDGGYYLIGLRGPWRDDYGRLFESIPWSTERVLARTLQIASDAGLVPRRLDTREDVDTLPALHRILASQSIDAVLRDSIRSLLKDRRMSCE